MAEAQAAEAGAPARPRERVLVVDDEPAMAETLAEGLSERGYDAIAVSSSKDAAARLAGERFDAVVTDLRMPAVSGLALLAVAKREAQGAPVIVMTAYGALDSAIECIRQGAYHYLTKPFKVDELALFLARGLDEARVRRRADALARELADRFAFGSLVGRSAAMRTAFELAERVAEAEAPLLVVGETGTGKSVFARAIHARGGRAAGPFVTINCGALPETLLESELFGHVRGAFTGATTHRRGLLEEADGGTLFLDEIGEMPPALQAKLLDVLERRRVRALGSNVEKSVDVRFVAATHRDLRERVAAGAFREDLLYRLDVVTLELPPLRHRRDDIPELAAQFLAEARARNPKSPVERLGSDVMARLLEHPFPGNVRELAHLVERLVLLGRAAEADASLLPPAVTARRDAPRFSGEVATLREIQRQYVQWAVEALEGKKTLAAEKLGIDPKTLAKYLGDK
jgi:two-component system response regulator HydG